MAFQKAKFLEFCRQECTSNGVKLIEHLDTKFIMCDGFPVSGYFDFEAKPIPELHVAKGRQDWHTILSHELAHMYQWKQQCLHWRKYCKLKFDFNGWLNGLREYTQQEVDCAYMIALKMERDCEKRSLVLLESFGYIKSDEYIRKGNAYTLFYLFVAEERRWSISGKSPYSLSKVWPQFPKTWNIPLKSTYKEIKHLYEHCI
jgi:hypothetical protein